MLGRRRDNLYTPTQLSKEKGKCGKERECWSQGLVERGFRAGAGKKMASAVLERSRRSCWTYEVERKMEGGGQIYYLLDGNRGEVCK